MGDHICNDNIDIGDKLRSTSPGIGLISDYVRVGINYDVINNIILWVTQEGVYLSTKTLNKF